MVKRADKKNRATSLSHPLSRAGGGVRLIFITDAARVPDMLKIVRALPAGSIVICRDYEHKDRAGLATSLRQLTREGRQLLLVAGDVRLARTVGADGVHLPQHQLYTRPNLSGFSFVTAACHDRKAMVQAARLGVDLGLVSPVFETRSHEGAGALGIHRFARLISHAPLAVAALGGVNSVSAKKLRPLDLAALAAIDGLSA
ncbi:thiamine phosphate synthase [Kordiimonas sp.]|uniref:thiamine phosphate synthase n=1 Tax=Kordiimonas sp. TaxID=1970157 RepID=UPI003A94349F